MQTFSDYDKFAWIYNKYWGSNIIALIMPIIENLILRNLSEGARILDLCCGTGQLAQVLSAMRYRVTGIDGSADMLTLARQNAPSVDFIQSDARSFKLPHKYQAVISTYDSLNHIMSVEELTEVFTNVHRTLRKGGKFLFDLSMEEGYKAVWNDNFSIVRDNHRYDVTIFHKNDTWQRADVKLYQKCYSEAEIRTAINEAGFADVELYGYDGQSGVVDLAKKAERVFFLCKK